MVIILIYLLNCAPTLLNHVMPFTRECGFKKLNEKAKFKNCQLSSVFIVLTDFFKVAFIYFVFPILVFDHFFLIHYLYGTNI